MSVFEGSRYTRSKVIQESNGEMYLTIAKSIDPTEFDDNRLHEVRPGENLWNLAHKHLGASKFWWVIADMNDIINPFIKLESGEKLIIPSLQTLHEEII